MVDLNLADYELYLKELYKSTPDNDLFMKLVEEIGEIAVEMNFRSGVKKGYFSKENFSYEIVDAIHYLVGIAAINNIDLPKSMYDKSEQGALKYNNISFSDFKKNIK